MKPITTHMVRQLACAGFALGAMLAPALADTVTIRIKSGPFRYEPKSQPIKSGDTVVWVDESGLHTVTPDDGQPDPFKGSDELNPPDTYQVVIGGDPRTIKYHCEIHGPMMSGEIVVTAAAGGATPTPSASPTAVPTPSPTK